MASEAAQADDQRRVLVVDDDAAVRAVLALVLSIDGYDVRSAADGAGALALAGAWRPDLILLDLMMPGMDGWAFRRAQLADARLAAIPVVVVSAMVPPRALPGERQRVADDLDAAAIFPKPWSLTTLLATVDQLMARSHGVLRLANP